MVHRMIGKVVEVLQVPAVGTMGRNQVEEAGRGGLLGGGGGFEGGWEEENQHWQGRGRSFKKEGVTKCVR